MTDPIAQQDNVKDQEMLNRLNRLASLSVDDKSRIVEVVDALIRDANARAAYAGTKRKNAS